MPAVSKKQQRFMGMVRAVQNGEMRAPSKRIADAAKSMKPSDVRDFARTKHDKLPEKKEKRADAQAERDSVIAALLAALSGVQFPGLKHSLGQWRYARRELEKPVRLERNLRRLRQQLRKSLRPYDIVIQTPLEDMRRPQGWTDRLARLVQTPRDHHAFLVVPDEKGQLKLITAGGIGRRPVPGRPALNAAISTWPQRLRDFLRFPQKFRRRWRAFSRQKREPVPLNQLPQVLGEGGWSLREFTEQPAEIKVLRRPGGLSAQETAKIERRLAQLGRGSFTDLDTYLTATNNFLFGKGRTRSVSPTACSGGVCWAYQDVLPLGDPSRAMPTDLAASRNLEEVSRVAYSNAKRRPLKGIGSLKNVRRQALSQARRVVGAKGLLFSLPLTGAAYYAHRAASGFGNPGRQFARQQAATRIKVSSVPRGDQEMVEKYGSTKRAFKLHPAVYEGPVRGVAWEHAIHDALKSLRNMKQFRQEALRYRRLVGRGIVPGVAALAAGLFADVVNYGKGIRDQIKARNGSGQPGRRPSPSEHLPRALATGVGAVPGALVAGEEIGKLGVLRRAEKLRSLMSRWDYETAGNYRPAWKGLRRAERLVRQVPRPSGKKFLLGAGLSLGGALLANKLTPPRYEAARNKIKISRDLRSEKQAAFSPVELAQLYLRDLGEYAERFPVHLKRASEDRLATLSRELDRCGNLVCAVKTAYADASPATRQRVLLKLAQGFRRWLRKRSMSMAAESSPSRSVPLAPSGSETQQVAVTG